MRNRSAKAVGAGLALCAMLLGAAGAAPPPAAPASPVPASAAAAAAAKPSADPDAIRVLLAAEIETTLGSQMAGRIRAVNASLGSGFGRGAALVSFDCDEPAARLRMAQAELASARQTHDAKLRLQGLQQAGEVEVALAAAAADKAKAQVGLYQAQLAQCTVIAPFAGRVAKLHVKPHQGVNAGAPLLDVIRDGPLKLRLNAPSKWLAWLHKGAKFEVEIDETGKRYPARVTAINSRVDAVSQTVELEASVSAKAPELLAGMSGTARFSLPK